MTIGTIDWGAHPGILEEVAAVFLAQEAPDAIRRTPASGDGGIDVLVPADGGWHVYQVKSFTERLRGGRRTQVEASLAEAVERPRLSRRRIVRWSLVVPIDPTPPEQEWFEGIAEVAPFPCDWRGEVWWNSMASQHGHVVDYYFRDGRERIKERVAAMTGAADLLGRPPTAIDVGTQYEVMRRALDKEDPHYRYDFHIGDLPLTSAATPDGAVLLSTNRCQDGDGFWSVYVTPKHRYSLTDSPIVGEMTIIALDKTRGIDIRQQIQDFRDFGCQLDIPEGAVSGHLRAPGGLSTEFEGGSLTISPMEPSGGLMESRLRLTDAVGVRHEVVLRTTARSFGEAGGAELHAEDPTGLLHLRVRVMPPEEGRRPGVWWNIALGDMADRPVDEVLPLVRFRAAARDGADLQWMERHGAGVYAQHRFDGPASDEDAFLQELLSVLEDLSVVQEKVAGTVRVPEEFDPTELVDLREVVIMIRDGEVSGTWTDGSFTLRQRVDRRELEDLFSTGGQLVQTGEMVITLAGQTYDVGPCYRVYRHAVLAKVQPLDDRVVAVEAGRDDSTFQRLGALPDQWMALPPVSAGE